MGGLKAILFDAGNTLIYMPRQPDDLLRELCGQIGISIDLEEARAAYLQSERYYVQHYLGYAGDQGEFWLRYYGEALRHLGIEDSSGEKAAFISRGFGGSDVWLAYPEAAEVCDRLRSMGLQLGVVSNGPTVVPDMLSEAGLLPFFDTVVTSQGAGVEKPDPRIFAIALEGLGVGPHEALFVGDLYEVDVLGAQAAGLLAVLIDRQGGGEGLACPVIRSLDELIPLLEG